MQTLVHRSINSSLSRTLAPSRIVCTTRHLATFLSAHQVSSNSVCAFAPTSRNLQAPDQRLFRSIATKATGAGSAMSTEVATLGGGCFWCLEACYQQLRGVKSVVSGYCNGHVKNPTYKQVCSGTTGHAEVVQITYDPNVVTFKELLEVFFTIHDPTQLNRQGNDVGTQYRSGIYYHNEQQKQIAEEIIERISKERWFDAPIVTEVKAIDNYSQAEDYHQNYYNDNPNQGYCQFVVAPKVAKFRSKFMQKLMATA